MADSDRGTVILDVDGTLVDTNYHHALCWFRALRRHDVTVPMWRIHAGIGMGGDQIVGSVAGDDVEKRHGDDLRSAWAEEFEPMLGEIQAFDGATELLQAIKDQGFGLVMASSGQSHHVERYAELIGGGEVADAWVSSADVDRTKPHPDLLGVAMERVGASRAVLVGDSVWDCRAAAALGIPSVAVQSGGFSVGALREAGAVSVHESVRELLDEVSSLAPGAPSSS